MKNRRLLALTLGVLMFCSSLYSCSEAEKADDSSAGIITEAEVKINESQFNKYKIIRSEHASDTIIKSAAQLYVKLQAIVPKISISDDFLKENVDAFKEIDTEILIGQTNRSETQEFLNSLMPWQYGYGMVGDKIVICGYTDEQTEEAVRMFETNILSRDELYYSENDGYIFGASKTGQGTEYSVVNITSGSGDIKSLTDRSAEYSPSVITIEITDDTEADYIPSGYAEAADGILYNEEVFVYSSSGTYRLNYDGEDITYMTYAVLRDISTLQKTVFCSVYLPDNVKTQAAMLSYASEFFGHCAGIPVILCGKYNGLYEAKSGTGEILFNAGLCDLARIAGAPYGESDVYITGSYSKLSPVSFEEIISEAQYPVYMCRYQRVK